MHKGNRIFVQMFFKFGFDFSKLFRNIFFLFFLPTPFFCVYLFNFWQWKKKRRKRKKKNSNQTNLSRSYCTHLPKNIVEKIGTVFLIKIWYHAIKKSKMKKKNKNKKKQNKEKPTNQPTNQKARQNKKNIIRTDAYRYFGPCFVISRFPDRRLCQIISCASQWYEVNQSNKNNDNNIIIIIIIKCPWIKDDSNNINKWTM